MKSVSRVGLVLSLVFAFLLLALLAELYYLLWWKRRNNICSRSIESGVQIPRKRWISFCLIWNDNPFSCFDSTPRELRTSTSNKDNFGEDSMGNLPRFLFTITEETKEDLESEDGNVIRSRKQSRNRSLSDFLHISETPYFTPPLTPTHNEQQDDFGLCFDAKSDAAFNKLRSSPPPKFKFLRDAEEKLAQGRG